MKSTFLIKNLTLCLAVLLVHLTYSQSFETKIDSMLLDTFSQDGPGVSFLIAKDGKPVYRKAFGKANLELDVNMTPESVFQIGSMTKQFTAISILMLEEQGKLSLNDDITKHIPDYPTRGKSITIHHLLTHTSGIKNYTSLKSIMDIAKDDLSPKELVDFFKNEPMDFDPGEQFKYCNSGYVILGYIIELVSGETYENFIETHIFQKIGMENSCYTSDMDIVKNRASGYYDRDGLVNKIYISHSIPYAAGSLMSTTDDMLIWQNALNTNKLVKPSTIKKVFTDYTLNNGEQISYGYGWWLKEIEEQNTRQHGGSIFGYKSMGVYVPEKDIYVLGLSNCDCNSPTQLTKDIATMAINEL
ncbi:serine hydrolase [Galbibacter sp. EGI 63066]|uniref:serine hydrolase domain-containing protein n=1 Tax=Galbibacter sp. EGI 63066 TaxID=2993559 RepID=UPI0022493775|nr:serine hydrolase domain-containing protein [Galbibacter sp. EGI 63066]MCX2681441.1 serine hydrolase [Galbibacter sp. EGI 63066]